MNEYITFHKVLDLIQQFQEQSPILNSFGYGNLVDFSRTISGNTVNYPYLFAVPQSMQYDENTTTYQISLIFADILNYDLTNEKDAVSDMSLEARRFLSYIKRGMRTFPELYNNLDVQLPAAAIPYMERMGDHVAGVALDCNILVFEDINACDYYPTPTPTISLTPTNTPTPTHTPTNTPTNTQTPTLTPSSTCPQTTQYLEVELSENTKFKLILWNTANFTSPATAKCDYSVSGTAYGDLGTIYTGTESISQTQHQHQFDLAPVLLPGETVSGFTVHSVSTVGCQCPVEVKFCREYYIDGPFAPRFDWVDCNGINQFYASGGGIAICALEDTVVLTTGSGTITELGDCKQT